MLKDIDTPVQYLKGVGPKRAKLLAGLGIIGMEDAIYFFPRRYEDRTNFLPVSRLSKDQVQTIKARVLANNQRQSLRRRGFSILEVLVGDDTGKVFCVWFNQPYLKNYFRPGETVILYGRVTEYSGRLQMNSPEFEVVEDQGLASLDIGRIVPIYTLPRGISQRHFRKIIKSCLDKSVTALKETLAYELRIKYGLLNLAKSLIQIHFPESLDLKKQAYRRLSFEEFFLFQIPIVLRKLRKQENRGIAHKVDGQLAQRFIRGLQFELTASQKRVISEIKSDMASGRQMQRLLQGDVGSGKTVVATIASLLAIQGNYQVAFMVPTEILARQHFEKITSQLRCAGLRPQEAAVELLTSGTARKEKEIVLQNIQDGRASLVIGTHALLEGPVRFKDLGLVVIDEQHKFGVAQRARLSGKGVSPDTLIMTATPIPRTLAITLYGDLDISVINELPPGRKPVETLVFSDGQRETVYKTIEGMVSQGRQAYVIYPIIDESFDSDLLAAVEMSEKLKRDVFPGLKIDLIHGRMKQKEQERVMSAFVSGEIDLLVATTVLEVGVDVANASVMVIEHAERFGLSQLHQLRGRVGRGPYRSCCILIAQAKTAPARLRIKAIAESNDGFRIAEEDLKIRGPGEFFGNRQHGLSELRIADPLTQLQLLKAARQEASRLVRLDPDLSQAQNAALRRTLVKRFPGYREYVGSL